MACHQPMTRAILTALVLAAGLGFAPAAPANAQAFNCAKAKTPTEITICKDQELRDLDAKQAKEHSDWLKEVVTGRQNVVNLQRRFLKERNACGADARCIRNAYKAKLWDSDNGHD